MVSKYLDIMSLILCVIITILLLIGCNKRYLERFENEAESSLDTYLSPFLKEIVDDLKAGKIDNKTITKYIRENKFTKKDLEKVLAYLAATS